MEAGAHVWCDDKQGEHAWILAEVLKKTDAELQLQLVDSPSKKFSRAVSFSDEETGEIKYEGVELANAKLSDQERADGRDNDLITLPHLHEPALLHAITERFFDGKIYTWTGPVLIAVNPFQRLPLYTKDILEKYRREGLLRSQGMGDTKSALGPHVYAIADRSYRQMMAEARKSQSILISGESGAGKTESTKIVMLYLTTLGAGHTVMEHGHHDGGNLSIMDRVLQSNPVLESFGNARTLRNDNSSRFGKFIELGFSRAGHLMGAKVQTYLLEKVRLAFHASGERNYHIFYQLLRGATDEEKKRYRFHDGATHGLELPNYFHYTGQGGAPHLREFTDEDGLKYTQKGMKGLGWSDETIDKVMCIIAGLLHLGQISFDTQENESGQDVAVVTDERVLTDSAALLGVDVDKLKAALTERIIVARGQKIVTQLPPEKAVDARDALSKTVYGALFLWVVDQVNQSICWEKDSDIKSSCGVLDIFGFECFATNSFEQLCINYTNEALQQQFNKFIFKMEQAEYEREKIEWAFIEFPDNQDCLDTIQQNKTGILAMLDDECRLPKGSDKNWANRMYESFLPNTHQVESDNTRFSASFVQKSKSVFCVRHFAGIVQYTAETGFMEKNKDEIPLTAQTLFETAPSQLIKNTYEIQKRESQERSPDSSSKPGAAKSKTVGQQFKEQLSSLIENVEKTDPHYIRCLKPNDSAKPMMLTRKRLTEQLRYGGVLEAVRVARMGYPVRLNHTSFFRRYRMLLPSTPEKKLPWSMEGHEPQKHCVMLVDLILQEGAKNKNSAGGGRLDPSEEGISRSEKIRRMQHQPKPITFPQTDVQLGRTKVFMRKPPHDALEAHRVFHQHAAATIIQSSMRGLESRKRFLILCHSALTAQRVYRGYKGRERWWTLRKAVAGQVLTNTFRMQIVRRRYVRAKKGTVQYQALYRGYFTRRLVAAVKVETFFRMRKHQTIYRKLKSATVALQCALRVGIASSVLAELKREQKDVGKLKQNNEKLKSEMASLKAMLAAQAQNSASNLANEKEMTAKQIEIRRLEKRVVELEEQLEREKVLVKKLEGDLERQKEQAEAERQHVHHLGQSKSHRRHPTPPSPQPNHQRRTSSESDVATNGVHMRPVPESYVSPEVLEAHKQQVLKLEEELAAERKHRREADGEIIKLRASFSGVQLDDAAVNALLPDTLKSAKSDDRGPTIAGADEDEADTDQLFSPTASQELPPEVTGTEEDMEEKYEEDLEKMKEESVTAEVVSALNKLGIEDAKDNRVFAEEDKKLEKQRSSFLLKSPSEYLPMIRRGFAAGQNEEKSEEPVVSVGWKVEVRNRKEREEALRDEVHRFEVKLKKFTSFLEEGVDVTMWQLSRNADLGSEEKDEFALKSSPVSVKLHRRSDKYVQAVLAFSSRGGYLSKAIGRHRDKAALDPLSLYDILEVKAGCSGIDVAALPSSGRSKAKKGENNQSSLFLTIKATPSPVASHRSYIFKFKSRSARNDMMNGLRGILADMQINEGVSISALHAYESDGEEDDVLVPLAEVHNAINREREAYDRLLLLLLQGNEDLKEKEDELLGLRGKLEHIVDDSTEKDRVQANDSKLIMQLSKKLETLLMDNEDLRDQNDRLNSRLIAVECEKMNMMNG